MYWTSFDQSELRIHPCCPLVKTSSRVIACTGFSFTFKCLPDCILGVEWSKPESSMNSSITPWVSTKAACQQTQTRERKPRPRQRRWSTLTRKNILSRVQASIFFSHPGRQSRMEGIVDGDILHLTPYRTNRISAEWRVMCWCLDSDSFCL